MKSIYLPLTVSAVLLLSACQTVPTPAPATPVTQPSNKLAFNITGKIGITTVTPDGKEANSAFYSWGQEDERFTIYLTGALGVGATTISYDGTTAKLISERTGEIVADSPELLLEKATGWQAPISQLPYWIVGQPAKDDHDSVFDNGKLTQSTNGDWTATLSYNDAIPNRLTINHVDGHRVVMTITHQTP